ncbi:uncharacterized protein LOC141900869 [Tubulanus polymorphus]|uniref:uncharacterized protein LOC141900869 n=1 Tax=Tubulanus polymorphus TaxID=672921 RepID=UPI003DA24511
MKNEKKMKHMKRIIINYESEISTYRDSILSKHLTQQPLHDLTNTTGHAVGTPYSAAKQPGSPVPEISPLADADEAAAAAAPAFDPNTYLQPIKSTKPSDYYYMLYGKDVKTSPRTRLAELLKDEKLPSDKKPADEPKKKQTVKEMIIDAHNGECPSDCKTS